MFYMIMPTSSIRDAFIAHLKARGIMSVFHYVPLHLSEMARRAGGYDGQCPVTEDISPRLVRLPFYNGLSESDQARVVEGVLGFRPVTPLTITEPRPSGSVSAGARLSFCP